MTPTTGSMHASEPGPQGSALGTIGRLRRRAERHVRNNVAWNLLYRVTSYVKSALWVIPFISIVLVLVIAPVLLLLDDWLGWRISGLGVEGARALCQTVITLSLSFMVFTFGSMLVAIQVASGQLTPRIISTTLLSDRVIRYTVGLFVFSLVFSVMALNRLEDRVHDIVSLTIASLGLACTAAFLFLIDYAARLLRPVSILAKVGDEGMAVIDSVYPDESGDAPDVAGARPILAEAPRRIVQHAGKSEIVLAVDVDTLVREAQMADGVIELVPQVGDFLATGEPLFVLHGGAASIADETLQATVAFGSERTMEQDPLFSFRIMVDIALKALSPAINDPTTAVLAIDQVHRLLRAVGRRQLRGETVVDETGRPRVIFRTPNWEDFVHISFTEIRACGAGSVQIARRLRAMLEDLIASLPAHRHLPLEQERQRLDRAIESLYPIPEDLALARVPDSQGLGASSGRPTSISRR